MEERDGQGSLRLIEEEKSFFDEGKRRAEKLLAFSARLSLSA
jgi:hypothetical protein